MRKIHNIFFSGAIAKFILVGGQRILFLRKIFKSIMFLLAVINNLKTQTKHVLQEVVN